MADYALVALVCSWIFSSLCLIFVTWREVEHRNQVDVLTSKIMSKDYAQYACYKTEESKSVKKELPENKPAKKHINDPVLGQLY